MTWANCLANKVRAGLVPGAKGKKAEARFREISDEMIRMGDATNAAYARAAEQTMKELEYAAKAKANRQDAQLATIRDLDARVAAVPDADLTTYAVKLVDDLDFDGRAILKRAHGRIGAFLKQHHPNLLGKVTQAVEFREFLKALKGEPAGNQTAIAFAQAVNAVNEDFRLALNGRGYNIGKLDNWGLTHAHNAVSIGRAGFKKWYADISEQIAWDKVIDNRTGEPFRSPPSAAFQEQFMRGIYDSIVHGRASKAPEYGVKFGSNPLERHRVLAFKDSEGWIKYNEAYGSGDPFSVIMQHMEQMSREVAMANRFGPDHDAAIDYVGQLISERVRKADMTQIQAAKAQGSVALAKRMVQIMSGGVGPNGYWGAMSARFFSTTRKVLTAGLLDRAIVISVPSDMNSVRMAAKTIGVNAGNVMSTYMGLLNDAVKGGGVTRDDLLRAGHVADSLANPGVTMARYEAEYPAAAWADVLSNASMRIQGMTAHTDSLRMAWKWGVSGAWAGGAKGKLDDLDPVMAREMRKHGITDKDWDAFREDPLFVASNGATFLDPIYWRASTAMSEADADALYLKMQGFVEKWTELAVPTGSLIGKGIVDPKGYGLAPGSLPYELLKTGGMFKSFPVAFMVNQTRMVNMRQGGMAKGAYIAELIGSSTVVGAVGIQINELLMGRDPQDMTDDAFWWRSVLRGGGLGPVGDILSTGVASWGGGVGSWVAGPVPQVLSDTLKLTLGNVAQAYQQAMNGDDVDTDIIPEFMKFAKRYMPMGQTPALLGGAAADRMLFDQLQVLLDPESADALVKAATKRANLYGSGDYWVPGDALPSRAPNLGNAIGSP